jgi:hypothetical protein
LLALWSAAAGAAFWSAAVALLLGSLAAAFCVASALEVLAEGVVALAALWSDALVFGFTGCEYEGAELAAALLDGVVVVVAV